MSTVTDSPRTTMRSDAVRNRDAILVAARALFAERGLDAPLDEIARRAGVGNATLYRRFATRDELLQAVFVDRMTEYVAVVDEALDDPDPWSGFTTLVLRLFQLQAQDRGLADLIVTTTSDSGELERLRIDGTRRADVLIDRAKAAGALRADFCHQDLVLLLMANAGLIHQTQALAPDSWRRVAAFLLDGLHERAATQAPPPPPEDQVVRVMGRRQVGSPRATS